MTFDQLTALDAIVATGTFRGAADRLNKAQSAISHQIRKLEDELQFDLFSRDEYRPRLTAEGEVFFRGAVRVLQQIRALQATALGLRGTQETEVRIAVSATVPLAPILSLLGRIGADFPATHIRLDTEMMGGPLARLMADEADMIIAGLDGVPVDQVETVPVGHIRIRPVAHPNFPLTGQPGVRTRTEAQAHVQVIVAGTGGQAFDQSRDVVTGAQRWTVTDFETKKAILLEGLGWGGLPEHLIADELERGELVALNIEDFPPRHTEIFAIRRRDRPPGLVMSKIWTSLRDQAAPPQ